MSGKAFSPLTSLLFSFLCSGLPFLLCPSPPYPIATCACGEAAWRAALPTALEMVLSAWELLAVP